MQWSDDSELRCHGFNVFMTSFMKCDTFLYVIFAGIIRSVLMFFRLCYDIEGENEECEYGVQGHSSFVYSFNIACQK